MIISCRKRKFDCREGDWVLDNGACYLLMSHYYNVGWEHYTPIMAKTTFKKLLKEGFIKRSDKQYSSNTGCVLYEFTEKSGIPNKE